MIHKQLIHLCKNNTPSKLDSFLKDNIDEVDINHRSGYPLMVCLKYGKLKHAEILLQHGAIYVGDINCLSLEELELISRYMLTYHITDILMVCGYYRVKNDHRKYLKSLYKERMKLLIFLHDIKGIII